MLKNGDLAAARSFFRRVADAGDARGALGMARSYDPEFLKTLGRHGLRPDRAAAQDWYARARSLTNGPKSE
jgi:TPR repeat protein